jgi:hypothetical protein
VFRFNEHDSPEKNFPFADWMRWYWLFETSCVFSHQPSVIGYASKSIMKRIEARPLTINWWVTHSATRIALVKWSELNWILIMVQFSGELLVSLSHLKVSGAGISSLVYFGSVHWRQGLIPALQFTEAFHSGDTPRFLSWDTRGERPSPQLFQGRGIALRVRCYSLTCLISIATCYPMFIVLKCSAAVVILAAPNHPTNLRYQPTINSRL